MTDDGIAKRRSTVTEKYSIKGYFVVGRVRCNVLFLIDSEEWDGMSREDRLARIKKEELASIPIEGWNYQATRLPAEDLP